MFAGSHLLKFTESSTNKIRYMHAAITTCQDVDLSNSNVYAYYREFITLCRC